MADGAEEGRLGAEEGRLGAENYRMGQNFTEGLSRATQRLERWRVLADLFKGD